LSLAISFIMLIYLALPAMAMDEDIPAAEAVAVTEYYEYDIYGRGMIDRGFGDDMPDIDEIIKDAIIAIKSVVEISDDWRFEYYYWGGNQITLQWNSPDWNAYVYATVTLDGKIRDFSKYEWSEERTLNQIKFAEISKEEAAKKCRSFPEISPRRGVRRV